MNYIVHYEACALLFLLYITIRYFTNKQFPSDKNKIFGVLCIIGCLDLTFDILGSLSLMYPQYFSLWNIAMLNTLFYVIRSFLPCILFFYVLSLLNCLKTLSKQRLLIYMFPALILSFAYIFNYINHWAFSIEQNQFIFYSPGNSIYFLAVLYFLGSIFYTWKYHQNTSKKRVFNLYFCFALLVFSMIMQIIFPSLLFIGVGITLSLMIMYFTITTPEEMMDPLTDSFNYEALSLFLKELLIDQRQFHIIAIDIHEMSIINQMFGIETGDQFLQKIVKYLSKYHSWVFRVMGTRFVIIDLLNDDIMESVYTIKGRFNEPWIINDSLISAHTTICYSIDKMYMKKAEDVILLIENTFHDEYKKGNKGKIISIDNQQYNNLNRKILIEKILKESLIKEDNFELYIQPFYDMKKQGFYHGEILIRLFDDHYGEISPAEFIPIAEKSGMIIDIDHLVLKKICTYLSDHPELKEYGIDSIHINLSAVEFMSKHLPETIHSFFKGLCIDKSMIVFEITETAASASHDILENTMSVLKKEGFRFSLDDFGKGYANMTEALSLPFDIIKLDKSLLDSESQFFFDLIKMFNNLDLEIVVEGVENERQINMLKKHYIDQIQGYYYAKPFPLKDYTTWIEKICHN